jgi:hypothetical protein
VMVRRMKKAAQRRKGERPRESHGSTAGENTVAPPGTLSHAAGVGEARRAVGQCPASKKPRSIADTCALLWPSTGPSLMVSVVTWLTEVKLASFMGTY